MHQHYLEDGGGSGEGLEGLEGPGKDLEGPPGASYPRSQLFSSLLSQEQYWRMSRAADDENHYPAKCLLPRWSMTAGTTRGSWAPRSPSSGWCPPRSPPSTT